MKHYLNCKKINTAIRRAKKKLINEVKTKGLYENFGQKECREIEEHFINQSDKHYIELEYERNQLQSFFNWCINYTGQW